MRNAQGELFLSWDDLHSIILFTLNFSTFTSGFRMSIKAAIAPLSIASITFPQSFITMQSMVSCHTNLPVKMQSDSGSRELLPTITFSNSLLISTEFFLFCSAEFGQVMQLTLNCIKPYDGLSGLGITISVLVFIIICVWPCEYTKHPT